MKKSLKILLCEDDEAITEALSLVLEDEGYTVFPNDGQACMDVIRREKPDLLLLDLRLTGYSGRDILQSIRKDTVFSQLPVIITSARPVKEVEEIAKNYGANGYVCKPFDIHDLLKSIEQFI